MGISWGALAGAFLAPFLFGLYWKKATKCACYASFIFGSGLMILNMLFRSSFPAVLQSPVNCGVVAMLAGFVIVPVVSLITRRPKDVEKMFECYEVKVSAPAKKTLGN